MHVVVGDESEHGSDGGLSGQGGCGDDLGARGHVRADDVSAEACQVYIDGLFRDEGPASPAGLGLIIPRCSRTFIGWRSVIRLTPSASDRTRPPGRRSPGRTTHCSRASMSQRSICM